MTPGILFTAMIQLRPSSIPFLSHRGKQRSTKKMPLNLVPDVVVVVIVVVDVVVVVVGSTLRAAHFEFLLRLSGYFSLLC